MANDILVTGAGGFLGKYVLDELRRTLPTDPEVKVHTLGLSPYNDYVVNLTGEQFEPSGRYSTVYHLVGACFDGDRRKLNVDSTRNLLASLQGNPPDNIVYISSTEVYGADEGSEINENRPPEPVSDDGITKLEAEDMLKQWCGEHGVMLTILRSPAIVGTGMHGPLRRLVNSIYRGNYHHIEDETSRVSVVHATDVARAAVLLPQIGGVYNITDGVNPSQRDLVDALAFRMNGKRVYTLRAKRARMLARVCDFFHISSYGKKALARRYSSLTFDDTRLRNAIDWHPASVMEYLKTHDYGENSL